MKRAGQIGLALAGLALGGCHERARPAPPSAAAETIAALRARPASPLGAARASGFGPGLRPTFAPGDRATAQVTFPARATGAVRLQDAATGLGVDVSLGDARDVAGDPTGGYLVYAGAHPSGAALVHRPLPEGTEDFLAFDQRPATSEVAYRLSLDPSVKGLRLVAGTLELLDAGGAPRLRVAPPYLVGADGARTEATLAVAGCAVDSSPAAPWGRPVTPPGASSCRVQVSWNDDGVAYPAVLDPRWTTTGSMTTTRQGHSATLLSTGNVLVVGGTSNGTTNYLTSAELFNPATGTWAATASMSSRGARTLHTAIQLKTGSQPATSGKVLIAGGYNGAAVYNVQLYDPVAGTFTSGTALTGTGRYGHAATLLANGKVLLTGGINGSTTLNTAEIFDPQYQDWSLTTGNMPSAHKFHQAVLLTTSNSQLSNKVLVFGGNDGTGSVSTAALYTPSTDTFTALTNLSSAREGHVATVLANGTILVTGGKNGSTTLNTTLLFDPSSGSGTWSSAGTMTTARQAHSATLFSSSVLSNGKVLVAGGNSGSGTLSTAELWDGNTTWTATTSLPFSVQGHTATVIGSGAVLIAGGVNGSTTLSSAALYDPSFALACTSNGQCATGFCVNGVCCDSACNGGCGACNLTGKVGTCSPVTSGTQCRAATGACDVAETCTGTSLACPADGLQPAATVCRAAVGACDVAETCSGTSPACPADAFAPASTVCRASAGVCDTAETCTGSSAACPADGKLGDGTSCNDGNACVTGKVCEAGVCSNGQTTACTGTGDTGSQGIGSGGGTTSLEAVTVTFPAGTFTTTTSIGITSTTDRPPVGTSAYSPIYRFDPDGAQFSQPAVVTFYVGAGLSHPTIMWSRPGGGWDDLGGTYANGAISATITHFSEGFVAVSQCAGQPNDTPCTDGNACTTGETCQNGVCTGGAAVTCQAVDQCHVGGGACVPETGCPAASNAPDGTACNDGDACTQNDTCQNGVCNAGAPIVCAVDQCHTAGTCDHATGFCTSSRVADGTVCDDGNRCSVGDSCHAGTCLPGAATGCSGAGQTSYVSVIDLGSTQGWSYANDINNHGVVAGTDGLVTNGIYQLGLAGSRAFRWTESEGLVYLPWSGTESYASSVNDAGVFSLTAGMTPGGMLPCRYDPAVDAQPQCQPNAGNGGGINASGTMTGGGYYSSADPNAPLRMFRINTGAVEILPSLPDPNPTYMQTTGGAIDANGTVYGEQLQPGSTWLGIRYMEGRGTEPLNSLLPAGSNWDVRGVSHATPTQIVGWGMHNGVGRAFRASVAADGTFTGITDLGIPAPFASDATNIVGPGGFNASGEIVGAVMDSIPFWPQRAFAYSDSAGIIDLNTLIDPQSQWVLLSASAINDNHEVVGYGAHNGLYRAFKLTLPALTCMPVDACHVATRDPVTGACASQLKPDGAACDDGNACTRDDVCQGGACSGATPVACQVPDGCHDAGTCNPGAARAQPPSTQDLIGWWKLDGDGRDASGGGHDLTIEGNVTPAPGRFGLGMKFDGASCMTAPEWDAARMQGATGMTMMAWISPSDAYVCPGGGAVMGKGMDYTAGTWCQPGLATTPDFTGSARPAGAQMWGWPGGWGYMTRNQWTHVAITWDHHQIRLYVNGVGVVSHAEEGDSGDIDPTFAIGCLVSKYFTGDQRVSMFMGTIDEAMLYRRVLSDAEISSYLAASDPCLHPNVADGTACNDGNACTQNDSCAAGTCVGGSPVSCPPPDGCHTAAACVPATGCAALAPKPDGSACDDGNACTRTDVCEAGVCIGANPAPCVAPDACHTATCDPGTGACAITAGAGTCDIGAFDYDKAGRLVRDRSAQLTYDAYDQLRQVTPVVAPPPIANLPVEDLAVAGSTQTLPGRLNRNGHVAVSATLASGVSHAVLFKGEAPPVDINLAAGVSTSLYGSSVNGVDTVAGTLVEPDGSTHAFRYDTGGLHDLGNPGDSTYSYDINDANQQVGFFTSGGVAHGYRYADGVGFQEIGALGGAQSWAWNIDDLGAVVASAETDAPPGTGVARYGHAALYQDLVGLRDLNGLIDPALGVTLVIANDHAGDWIVGTDLAGSAQHGYRLRMSTGALDEAAWAGSTIGSAVNAAGDAVGWGYTDAGNTQQAAWILSDRTGFANLNDLIDPASGWNLQLAAGIDDLGDVVGWGYHNGVVSAFRLRIPLHSSGTGGPAVAEAHTYGYDGLRTSTTTGVGTATASTQFWLTQDYTEHDGLREHYLRVGDRIVAKITMQPPPGGGMGLLRDGRRGSPDRGDLVAQALLALLLLGGLGVTVAGVAVGRRRPAWVARCAGPVTLFFLASCETLGTSRHSAETAWQRVATVYFHQGVAAGPVLTTNADGTLKEERRYEPFGQPVDANVGGTIGPVDFRREQQNSLGKLTNPNTGWSYHGARWMQPQTARWTAPDPLVKAPLPAFLQMPWGLNPYAFVGGSPTLLWDPNGAEGATIKPAPGPSTGWRGFLQGWRDAQQTVPINTTGHDDFWIQVRRDLGGDDLARGWDRWTNARDARDRGQGLNDMLTGVGKGVSLGLLAGKRPNPAQRAPQIGVAHSEALEYARGLQQAGVKGKAAVAVAPNGDFAYGISHEIVPQENFVPALRLRQLGPSKEPRWSSYNCAEVPATNKLTTQGWEPHQLELHTVDIGTLKDEPRCFNCVETTAGVNATNGDKQSK